jgi:hypothetical protein
MGIVGTPESGVRIDVSRPRDGGPPWRYEGEALTPEARHPVIAVVSADGQVAVDVPGWADATAAIADRVRLLLRAAYKHAREDGQPPPRQVVRWRADVDVAPPRPGG